MSGDTMDFYQARLDLLTENNKLRSEIARLREELEECGKQNGELRIHATKCQGRAEQAEQREREALALVARFEEALTPSEKTKGAYIGEFSFDLTETDVDGTEYTRVLFVPWWTTKQIMYAILTRAREQENSTAKGGE